MKPMMFNNSEATRIFFVPDFSNVLLVMLSSKATVNMVKQSTYVYGMDDQGYVTWINVLNMDTQHVSAGLVPLSDTIKTQIESSVQVEIPWVDSHDFLVGQIVDIEPLERFQLAKVDIGRRVVDIVCGAANLSVNQKTVVALDNSVLPDGSLITAGQVGGIESLGMLCSLSELTNKPSPKGIVTVKQGFDNGSVVNLSQLEEWLC